MWMEVTFHLSYSVAWINIMQNYLKEANFKDVKIVFSDGTELQVNCQEISSSATQNHT
jgi:hypothetical protein